MRLLDFKSLTEVVDGFSLVCLDHCRHEIRDFIDGEFSTTVLINKNGSGLRCQDSLDVSHRQLLA